MQRVLRSLAALHEKAAPSTLSSDTQVPQVGAVKAQVPEHLASFKFRTLPRCLWEVACPSCMYLNRASSMQTGSNVTGLDAHRGFLTGGPCLGPSSPYHTQCTSLGCLTQTWDMLAIVVRHLPPRSLRSQSGLQGPGHIQEASTEVKAVAGPFRGSLDLGGFLGFISLNSCSVFALQLQTQNCLNIERYHEKCHGKEETLPPPQTCVQTSQG